MTVIALVGAQYGSEGKGAIAAKIANDFNVHVRTGAPNAGHTYYFGRTCDHRGVPWTELYGTGNEPIPPSTPTHHRCSRCGDRFPVIGDEVQWPSKAYRHKIVARSVPVGASNPNAHLVIGPGALIDVDLLVEEALQLNELGLDVTGRLIVDARAIVIDKVRHHQEEGGIHGEAHRLIGSTGEGVGLARMAHLNRKALVKSYAWTNVDHAGDDHIRDKLTSLDITVRDDASRTLTAWDEEGAAILLEGTQGSGLSSVYGPWPYCTSGDTNSGQLLVDAGLSPKRLSRVILVARTHPIRVAGNSGPLRHESDWNDLGIAPEFTTVTKKMRRVGLWDDRLLEEAIMRNGPHPAVALTFVDYVYPEAFGVTEWNDLPRDAKGMISYLRWKFDAEFVMAGTGPDSVVLAPSCKYGRQ